ncbi:hypothetical protein psal_cds_889 [Pandoravirus salinus]|uniref:Uncharacterized protein n=1 Tax=Pandoravirus salinus TaxID=1349410 RepID=S4VZQ0_9VIRU|nr:hypothetical protein psal_cds_889 [Pandoravirus salinus]AGO84976.1 hypothetical protein psal_cds_889 [Pandoravirus salinus]
MGTTTSTLTAGPDGVAISGTASVTQSTSMAHDAPSTLQFDNICVTGRGGTVTVRRDGGSLFTSDTISTTCAETDIVYAGALPPSATVRVKNAGGDCTITHIVGDDQGDDGAKRIVASVAPSTMLLISPLDDDEHPVRQVRFADRGAWDGASGLLLAGVLASVAFFIYR